MALGEKLKQARLNKSYTQDFMADMLNISQKTYSNFENNKTTPDFSQIEQIAKILEVSVLDFLTDDKLAFNYNNIHGGNNGFVLNNLPEKLIEQYELRIQRIEEENQYLKTLLNKFANE